MRAGKGKLRNRRRVQKLGPLVIYDQDQVIIFNFFARWPLKNLKLSADGFNFPLADNVKGG